MIDMILLKLSMSDPSTSLIFYVIDSKTSYKLLLKRPWFHEHGMVSSTLHQCLKYYNGGKRTINDDIRSFTKKELHFADSKFLAKGFAPKEMMISTICSTGKGDSKAVKDTSMAIGHNDAKQQQRYKEDDKQVDEVQLTKQVGKKWMFQHTLRHQC